MAVEKRDPSLDEAQALPDAVAQHEARIEHRDDCLVARDQVAVHRDQDRVVARILAGMLRAGRLFDGHGRSPGAH